MEEACGKMAAGLGCGYDVEHGHGAHSGRRGWRPRRPPCQGPRGEEIVIEKEASPPVVLHVLPQSRGRLLSDSIALAEAHASDLGYEPTVDAEFAADLEEIIRSRKPRQTAAWD